MEFLNNTVESQLVQRPLERGITPFNFPKTKSALWDPTPLDDSISIHLTYYRNPKLLVTEKILRFVHRHAKQSGRKVFSCFLLGSFVVDDDEEGVTLIVDRLDPGREAGHSDKVPTAPLPEDFIIPCIIDTQGLVSRDTKVYSSEDFKTTFKMLYHYCCSKETIDSSRLLVLRGRINCSENLDNLSLELQWAAVTVAITFDATPINAVPIIPTALARNLTSPLNIAQVQGTYKFGYLTMDQTRKLLLILESDPKVFTLPLVGIWLSGATHVHSPQVWACCLRYLFSSSIQERVFSTEQKRFLLVLYSVTHRQPEFYECQPCGEHQKLDFQLLTSTEVLNICTSIEPSGKQLTEFELSDENKNPDSDFFKEVVSNIMGIPMSVGDNDSGVEEDDLSPRPTPSPHPVVQKFPRVYPSVPELSLVFDGSFIESKYTPTRLQQNKLQQTMKTRETSGPLNASKQPSENGQQGVTSKMITPPLKHNLILSHGSVASVNLEHEQEGNGTMGLPVNAYKILVEQDRQLKLLQAQIQRLLGTQSGVTTPVTHCSSKNISISDCSPQPERQMEFVAIETQTSPGIHMKKSVSIAVSTGASLFLVPSEEHEAHQSVQNLELNDSELSNEEMGVSVKTDNTSHTSVVSSMNEVDIHNFVENSQNTTDTSDQAISVQSCTPEGTKSSWDLHVDFQSPVLGESASTCLKNCPTEVPHVNNSKTEKYDLITESHNSSPLQDERRFYQNLMGQVNQLLESSSEKQNEAENEDAESEVSVQSPETLNKPSEPRTFQKEDNDVLSATVKQLKKMGVKFDLDCTSMTKSKVENASTLARINPEAVIPRLNYTSFVNVGAVELGAAGVDLSMEANAIALKYLNDAQLSQISLRRSGNCESPSLNNLLEMNTDGSMVGLSLISPNNMSFATRKYMRRYGLVEETYSSEEEDVLSDSAIRPIKSESEIPSAKKTSSEKVVEAQLKNCCTPESFSKADGNILRNITNEISPTRPQNVDTQDCHCQQIRKNPKPKMNKFAEEIDYTKNPEKENGIERISDFSKKLRPTVLETHKSTKSSDAVGNILDVNRLRQLPKLF
ncbi:hypothetical protein chiPu_0001757 [Chiloscyllium punctatum]|uniref:SCL-interrupting locus protein n=1 Tax=Chiloscyllium punctatum TaxID=137246 RepID=A0A401RYX7_CHIPU|nr:hypothetical protein [Chiloscyllium punctatum]